MEDLLPFSLNTVYKKIGHQSLQKISILNQEKLMLETLKFSIKFPTVYNFTSMFLVKYFNGTTDSYYNLAFQIVDYMSKISQHDYDL